FSSRRRHTRFSRDWSSDVCSSDLAAGVRGERDIAVGNIVGSNIFNLLFVLGGAALIAPTGMVVPPAVLTFDMPVMLAVAIACLRSEERRVGRGCTSVVGTSVSPSR